jgi:hypothetical protein
VASEGDVRFSGGLATAFDGRMLAENGYSIHFDTATLSSTGEMTVRGVSSFIFAPRIENSGAVELVSGGSLRTLQFQNAAGSVQGEGRIVFSDFFFNDGGQILASQGHTLALAATARNVHWDLDGNSPLSLWHADNGGTIRLGAAAAEVVQVDTFGGSMRAANGGSIEFTFPREFDFPVGSSGNINLVGPDANLVAPQMSLMIGTESLPSGSDVAIVQIEQGRLEVDAVYVGGNDERCIAVGVLQLSQGMVFANREIMIWPTGRVEGVGTIQASVVNSGTLTGSFDIHGTYFQGPEGVLAMEIANSQSHDRLVIAGHASLDGTLELRFTADVNLASQLGRTFDLFDWTGVNPTGSFAVFSPYTWNLSNLYTTGEVTLTAISEPAAIVLLLSIAGPIIPVRRRAAQKPRPLTSAGSGK